MRVTFLGTGTSVGVPRIACKCPVCLSDDPKNKRLRCSILLEYGGRVVLVDTGPDLRTQALRYAIDRVDAVLITHGHADHLHGLDDIRAYCFSMEDPMPCYADERTMERINLVFGYAFDSPYKHALPQLDLRLIDGPFELFGIEIEPVEVLHGRLPVLGFRVGSFAYVTDCSQITDASMMQLEGLDTLVLDALRHKEHATHFTVEQALAVVKRLQPRMTYFTHMAHDLEHEASNRTLPSHAQLAYDGLVLEL
jgi:phosphoribosyl 1,2-cyclic phosphate phosphodiesterase